MRKGNPGAKLREEREEKEEAEEPKVKVVVNSMMVFPGNLLSASDTFFFLENIDDRQ